MARLEVVIIPPDGHGECLAAAETVRLLPNCDHTFHFDFQVPSPRCWTPETPELYRAELRLFHNGELCHQETRRFGIRTVDFRPDGFFLNGRKYDLIGTNRHQEYPFVGNAVPATAQRRDAALIKNGGYNWVRLSHYNQHPAFLDACDELGLLVMAPIPGWQQYHCNEPFVNHSLRDCRELARTLRNRPSVMLYEVSLNESYPPCWMNREFHQALHAELPIPGVFTCGDTIGFFEDWDVLFYHDHLETDKPMIVRECGDWEFGGNASTSRARRGDGAEAMFQQAWNFQWALNRARRQKGVVGRRRLGHVRLQPGIQSRPATLGERGTSTACRATNIISSAARDARGRRCSPPATAAASWCSPTARR